MEKEEGWGQGKEERRKRGGIEGYRSTMKRKKTIPRINKRFASLKKRIGKLKTVEKNCCEIFTHLMKIENVNNL